MPTVRRFATSEAPSAILAEIRGLLVDAFGGEFSNEDWEHTLGGWHVVVVDDDLIRSHAAVVPRILEVAGRPFRAGYVEGVATSPERREEGLGSLAMTAVSELLRRDYALGALSTGRHEFYERLGWERWQGPTFVRDGATVTRTADEDDGVMVLRFGPSTNLDLAASISCEVRSGDAW